MYNYKIISRLDERIAIPAPRSNMTLPPIPSPDGLWAWEISFQVRKQDALHNEVTLACAAIDLKSPDSTRRILWGGGISYLELNSMEWEENYEEFNDDVITGNLKTYSRFLKTPYEFFSVSIRSGLPNELELKISLSISIDESAIQPELKPSQPRISNLSKDLDSLLKSEMFSDVKLCTEGQVVPAHRIILAARSQYFQAKFKPEWAGDSIDVDVSLPVLKELLRYMYTGELENETDIKVDLLIAADMYLMPDLCAEMTEKIGQSLEADKPLLSVFDLLGKISTFSSPSLQNLIIKYMLKHRNQVLKSEEWKTFQEQNYQLAADIALQVFNADVSD